MTQNILVIGNICRKGPYTDIARIPTCLLIVLTKLVKSNLLSHLSVVDGWLESHLVDLRRVVRSPAKDWAAITVPISSAEVTTRSKF